MAFVNAQKSRILVGQVSFSGYTRSAEFGTQSAMHDTTTLADTARKFIVGPDESTFSLEMVFDTDTTANGQWDRLKAWKAAGNLPVSFFPSGMAALSEAWLLNVLEADFTTRTAQASTVDASVQGWIDGAADAGYSLSDLDAITGDTNGTARDLTASSSNGGVGHLHVTAFSGFTSDAITIQDSADGSTDWQTILTFTTATGVTSERVAITGTVRRYLRVVDDVTGTGSITRQVSFARR